MSVHKKSFTLLLCCYALVSSLMILSGCAKQKKKETMSFDELSSTSLAFVQKNDYDHAVEYLEQIIARFPDNKNIARYKMVLAEMLFKKESFAGAHETYEHYSQLYPADKYAEYAKFRSVLSKSYQTLSPDCDQTETDKTLALCDQYLENPSHRTYRPDVQNIRKGCVEKLIEKEIYVFDFYCKQHQFDAAQKRLTFVKDKYLAQVPALAPRLHFLACKLARRKRDEKEMNLQVMQLMEKFPESPFTPMAQALVEKQRFSFV